MNSTAESKPDFQITEIDLLRSGAMNRLLDLARQYDRMVVGVDMEGVLCPQGLPRQDALPGRKGRPIFTTQGMDLLRTLSRGKPGTSNVRVCTASRAEYSPNVPSDFLIGIQERRGAIMKRMRIDLEPLSECTEPEKDKRALFVFVSDEYDWNRPPEQLIGYLRQRSPGLDVLLVPTPTLDQEMTISEEEFWQSLDQGLKGNPRKIGNIINKN